MIFLRKPVLHRRVSLVRLSHDNVARDCFSVGVDDGKISVRDLCLNHRVTTNFEDKTTRPLKQGGEVNSFVLFNRLVHHASGHTSGERQSLQALWPRVPKQFDGSGFTLAASNEAFPFKSPEVAHHTIGRGDLKLFADLPNRRAVTAIVNQVANK